MRATLSLLLLILTSCGGVPSATQSRLSPSQHRAFENWKERVAKSCFVEEVFPEKERQRVPREGLGVDLARLAQRAPEGLVSREERTVLLGKAVPFEIPQRSSVSRRVREGEATYELVAELRREGAQCSVWLYGEKVYETRLAAAIWVELDVDTGRGAGRVLVRSPVLSPAAGGLAKLDGHGIDRALWEHLRPSAQTQTFLGEVLRLTTAESRTLWRLRKTPSLGHAFVVGSLEARPFSFEFPTILGPFSTLQPLSEKAPPFTAGLRWQGIFFPAEVNLERQALQVVRLGKPHRVGWDSEAALTCVQERLAGFSGGKRFLPSYQQALGPCAAWVSDWDELLLNHPKARAALLKHFDGFSGGEGPFFGWDRLVKTWALQLRRLGLEFGTTLNPDRKRPALQAIHHYLETLFSQKLSFPYALEEALVRLAVSWGFRGTALSDTEVRAFTKAVARAYLTFPESTQKFLQALEQGWASQPPIALAFLQNLTEVYYEEAEAVLDQATRWGLGYWANSTRAGTLQRRIPLEKWRQWRAALAQSVSFWQRELTRGFDDSERMGKARWIEWAYRALEENWGEEEWSALESITDFARRHLRCPYLDASAVANCVGASVFSRADRSFFTPSYRHRYRHLVEALAPHFKELDTGSELVAAFGKALALPLWASCRNEAFEERKVAWEKTLIVFLQQTDPAQQAQHEQQLIAALKDCDP